MKIYYFLLGMVIASLLLFGITAAFGQEQPPFHVDDPAAMENFRQIYFLMSQHQHNDPDSSRLANIILGTQTGTQLKTSVPVSSGTLIYNSTDRDLYVATGTSAGFWRNIRTGGGP